MINSPPTLTDTLASINAEEALLRSALARLDEQRNELLVSRGVPRGYAIILRGSEPPTHVGLWDTPIAVCDLRIAYDEATGGAKVQMLVGSVWHTFYVPGGEGPLRQVHIANDVAHQVLYSAWVYVFGDEAAAQAALPTILSRHGRPPPTP